MLNVTDRQKLHRYAAGVTARAKHHAANVDAVFHALLGFVSTYADKITLRGDGTGNVAWFTIGNNRYAFTHRNAPRARIVLLQGSLCGRELHAFTNDTPNTEINQVFDRLVLA